MTPEDVARMLLDELIDDIDALGASLERLVDRWSKYGTQYQHLLTPADRARLEDCHRRFDERMSRHGIDTD